MQSISTIGLDIAKSVFQVHGVDAAGQLIVRRQLRRRHVLASPHFYPIGEQPPSKTRDWLRATRSCDYPMWTAPPPARERQGMGAVLGLPRFGGAAYAINFDDRSGYREVGLSSAWC